VPKSTGVKVADMNAPVDLIERSVNIVQQLVNEGRHAQACAFLYSLHKNHLLEWVQVKRVLLSHSKRQKTLQLIASLLEASKKDTLLESASLIPGLGYLSWSDRSSELTD
jgi:hypothetical protein